MGGAENNVERAGAGVSQFKERNKPTKEFKGLSEKPGVIAYVCDSEKAGRLRVRGQPRVCDGEPVSQMNKGLEQWFSTLWVEWTFHGSPRTIGTYLRYDVQQ